MQKELIPVSKSQFISGIFQPPNPAHIAAHIKISIALKFHTNFDRVISFPDIAIGGRLKLYRTEKNICETRPPDDSSYVICIL